MYIHTTCPEEVKKFTIVVNDLWFQHPLLEERQQNLRVFTVEIYRREEIQKKRCRKNTL